MPLTRPPTDLVEMYRLMLLTRRYTEHSLRWYREGRIIQGLHPSIGQEAVGVGACYGLRQTDWVLPSLRTSEAFFVRGVSLRQHIAAMNGRATGISRGKDTSHHAGYPDHGVLAGTGMVGSHIPVGVGAALALKMMSTDNVVIVFFGDGASNRGDFHEGLNLAASLQAPVIFVCENNRYAQTVPASLVMRVDDIATRAAGYGMPGVIVDGQDIFAVQGVVQTAVDRARAGHGPTLIECKTYRFAPHHVTFVEDRPLDEVDRWQARDPIRLLGDYLINNAIITSKDLERIDAAILTELDEAIRFAETSPWPTPDEAFQYIYMEEGTGGWRKNSPHPPIPSPTRGEGASVSPSPPVGEGAGGWGVSISPSPPVGEGAGGWGISTPQTTTEALNAALREEMQREKRVFVLGEDIGLCNGLFGVTRGLLDEFGPGRVIDTPISESGIVGVAIGAAMLGLRPVVEIQFTDAATIAMDQIVNTAAKVSYVHAGLLSLPLVVRLLNLHAGTVYSSQALEAWFMHTPGLKVVTPATPEDAKGLLKAAIRDPNPVIFIENRALYNDTSSVPVGDHLTPLGQAIIRRPGRDVTVVAYGQMVPQALAGADSLAQDGIDVEVVDLRTLSPLDTDTVLASVRKTGRLVVAHEAVKQAGPGAEIVAVVSEHAWDALKAPVRRVANPGVPVPFSPALHKAILPDADAVIQAVRDIVNIKSP